jgi:hypothetical protein
MSDWEINWKKVAQEAERVRDLALAAKQEATLARVAAEQELAEANERAANLSVELAAMTLGRDRSRQEADTLRRQVEALAKVESRFPMQGGPTIDMQTAREVYRVYACLCGTSQSLERLGERGGFGWAEVEMLFKKHKHDRPKCTCDRVAQQAKEGGGK